MKPMGNWLIALIVSLCGTVIAQPTSYNKLRQEYVAAIKMYKEQMSKRTQYATNQQSNTRI